MSRLKEPNSVTGLLPQYRPEDRAYHVFRIVFYLIRCNDLIADDALRAIFEKTFIDLYCAEALRSTATFDELINLPIRKMALKSYMKSTFGFYAKGIAALRNDDKKGAKIFLDYFCQVAKIPLVDHSVNGEPVMRDVAGIYRDIVARMDVELEQRLSDLHLLRT